MSSGDKKLIHSVKRVEYAFLLRNPPYLNIRAEGETATAGWCEPELRIKNSQRPAADGILELDFFARPPDNIDTQASAPVNAEMTWKEDVYSLRGVRVFSANNDVKVVFADHAGRGK